MSEKVSHPEHYSKSGHKECIEEMRDQYGDQPVYWFCLLNAHKYIYRAGIKAGESKQDDLKKAAWYLGYAQNLRGEEKK